LRLPFVLAEKKITSTLLMILWLVMVVTRNFEVLIYVSCQWGQNPKPTPPEISLYFLTTS